MITASHNPKEYNGIKLRLKDRTLWGEQLQEIRYMHKEKLRVEATERGKETSHPIIDEYILYLADHFKHLKGMPFSAVIDCANGAGAMVMPKLVETMQWPNVQLLYCDVDGTFPNHEADPVVEENMADVKKALASTDASVGLGLDGDCDRMAPMTKSGLLVPGDMLLAVFAQPIIKDNPGMTVVFDIKASSGLIEILEEWGARPVMTPSGHAIISENMKKHKALLAGELSCHFFFADRYFGYDDGIYAALRLFELLNATGKSLQELIRVFPKKFSSREYRIECNEEEKFAIVEHVKKVFEQRREAKLITVDGVRAAMPYGWGLARASNTQPALSIRFEGNSEQGLQQVKEDFYQALRPYFDGKWLQEQLELSGNGS